MKNLLICLCCLGLIASCGLKGPLYQTPEQAQQQQEKQQDNQANRQEPH